MAQERITRPYSVSYTQNGIKWLKDSQMRERHSQRNIFICTIHMIRTKGTVRHVKAPKKTISLKTAPKPLAAPLQQPVEIGRKRTRTTKLTGASLERWRIENGLNAVEGTEAFGLPIAKWYKIVGKELKQPLSDLVLGLTLSLYTHYPAAAPAKGKLDIREFYEWLGFEDNPSDKNDFARLIGREPPSVYRLLGPQGKPGRPLIRYIEGLLQLKLDPESTRRIMEQIAEEVIVNVDSALS